MCSLNPLKFKHLYSFFIRSNDMLFCCFLGLYSWTRSSKRNFRIQIPSKLHITNAHVRLENRTTL